MTPRVSWRLHWSLTVEIAFLCTVANDGEALWSLPRVIPIFSFPFICSLPRYYVGLQPLSTVSVELLRDSAQQLEMFMVKGRELHVDISSFKTVLFIPRLWWEWQCLPNWVHLASAKANAAALARALAADASLGAEQDHPRAFQSNAIVI